jgi:hypothetical protein
MELNNATDSAIYIWGTNYTISENNTLTEYTSFSLLNGDAISPVFLSPGIIVVIVYDTSVSKYYLLPVFDIRVYADPFYSVNIVSSTDTNEYYILNPNTVYYTVGYFKDITDNVNKTCTMGDSTSCGDSYITFGATAADPHLLEMSYCICVDKTVFDIYSSYGPSGSGNGSGSVNTINQKTIYVIGIILIILIIIVVIIVAFIFFKKKKGSDDGSGEESNKESNIEIGSSDESSKGSNIEIES